LTAEETQTAEREIFQKVLNKKNPDYDRFIWDCRLLYPEEEPEDIAVRLKNYQRELEDAMKEAGVRPNTDSPTIRLNTYARETLHKVLGASGEGLNYVALRCWSTACCR
jgi:hypothetical protein